MYFGLRVGRAAELQRVEQALNGALRGECRALVVNGEAGIGKTWLLRELLSAASSQGATTRLARAFPGEGAPPYWPWVQILSALSEMEGDDGVRELAGPASNAFFQLIGWGTTPRSAPAEGPTGPSSEFALFHSVATFLSRLAAKRPLVLGIDDLEHADPATLELFHYLVRTIDDVPLLLAGAYRSGVNEPVTAELPRLSRARFVDIITLDGLSAPEIADFVEQVADVRPSSRFIQVLSQATRGNPFFLEEALDLLQQRGDLKALAGDPDVPEALPIPTSVRAVLQERFASLPGDAKSTIEVAAVAGLVFDYRILPAIESEERVTAALDAARRARIIEASAEPGTFRFVHSMMRETVLERLAPRRQSEIRGRIADLLEDRARRGQPAHVAEIAAHLFAAAKFDDRYRDRAMRFSLEAAAHAEEAAAWQAALVHYEHALELSSETREDATLLLALGRCQRMRAQWRPAWGNLMRAADQFRAEGDPLGLAAAALEAAEVPAPPARQRLLVEEALAGLPPDAHQVRARLLTRIALLQPGPVGEHAARKARALRAEHGLDDLEAQLLEAEALTQLRQSRLRDAYELFHAAGQEFIRSHDVESACECLRLGAEILAISGDIDGGEQAIRSALAYSRRLHAQLHQQLLTIALRGIALARADYLTLDALNEDPDSAAGGYWPELQAHWRLHVTGEGAELVRPAPDVALAGGVPAFAAIIHGARSRILFNAGDANATKRELRAWQASMAADPGNRPGTHTRLLAIVEAGEALAAAGTDAQIEVASNELERWKACRFALYSGQGVDWLRGRLAFRMGQYHESESHFRTGLEWAASGLMPFDEGRCLEGLADLAEANRDDQGMRDHLRLAIDRYRVAEADRHASRVEHRLEEAEHPGDMSAHRLTRREIEVLRLISLGRSNEEIAQELVISTNTVLHHVTHILSKTGTSNRTQAARFAIRSGIGS